MNTKHSNEKHSRAQIVATIGPSSDSRAVLCAMIEHQMDVLRMNFSWGEVEERTAQVLTIREIEKMCGRKIPIIADLPGPRVQSTESHTYEKGTISAITQKDKEYIKFGIVHGIDYFAASFVGGPEDVLECKKVIEENSGKQRVIAKIERKIAVENIDAIIEVADAIMVARGDLGNEVPLEQIPFIQEMIIKKANKAGKPVITATQMMLSMTENPVPTRAEVTDVANAILQGSDAVMLSEETARGKYPVQAITMMEKIVVEAERHMKGRFVLHTL